jgi:uncharacterized membrane protein SpoIIM required for sporulation
MFSTGLSAISESIIGIFGLALLIHLEGTSWLIEFANDYKYSNWSAMASLATSPAFIWTVLAFMIPAAVVAFILYVVAGGFVYSAEYGSYWQAQGGAHVSIPDVMTRFVEKWRPMAWTLLLSNTLTAIPLVASTAIFFLIAYYTSFSLLSVLAAGLILLAGAILTVILALLFVYTPVAVAAENLSGLGAIRRSSQQARSNLRITLAYSIVYIVLISMISYAASLIPLVNMPLSSLASVGILILVTPVLHLMKTEIFAETLKPEQVEFVVYNPLFPDLWGALPRNLWKTFLKGVHELKDFTLNAGNLRYHLLSAGGLLAGLALGAWLGNNGLTQAIYTLGYVPGKINPAVTGAAPLTTGVYIFFHNWETSLATALSGVWFPAIPFTTLLLNGVLIGVVIDLVPNTSMLAASLLPHGVIEIPSFILAGSAGIKLGVYFYRHYRGGGPKEAEEFHNVAKQTVYLIIGLALLFFIAGLIEGNVTPVIMRMAGWT